MDLVTKRKLEAAGWQVGDATDLLGLTDGRLVVDELVDLPEGTVLEPVPDDEDDELEDDERRALHTRLAGSAEQAAAGDARSLTEVLSELRTARRRID